MTSKKETVKMKINNSNTLVFFGAGSTAQLKSPITWKQEEFLKSLCEDGSVKERLGEFAKENFKNKGIREDFLDDIERTLTILYDGNGDETEYGARKEGNSCLEDYFDLLSKEFQFDKRRRASLEQFYYVYVLNHFDWLAFKSIFRDLSNFSSELTIQDILSVLTKGYLEEISIPTSEIFREERKRTLGTYVNYPQRLLGALNIYRLLIFKLFKHSLRDFIENNDSRRIIRYYKTFSEQLIHYGSENLRDIQSTLKFATLNWDPIFPFFLIRSVRDLNHSPNIEGRKRYYLSYGFPFKVVRPWEEKGVSPGYIIDEDAAFYSKTLRKDYNLSRVETYIIKFYVPHGLMNMRVCPRCKNTFLIIPDRVGNLDFERFLDVFLLDPILSKLDIRKIKKIEPFKSNLKNLNPSQVKCPYCGTPTNFIDTFLQIQSILKPKDPPAIEKSYFDYAISFADSEHLIFIGYSFPIDDIPHLLTLLTLGMNTTNSNNKNRKFSLILHNPHINKKLKGWISYDKALTHLRKLGDKGKDNIRTLRNVLKLAKRENIRVNFSGFPGILQEVKFKNIVNWTL